MASQFLDSAFGLDRKTRRSLKNVVQLSRPWNVVSVYMTGSAFIGFRDDEEYLLEGGNARDSSMIRTVFCGVEFAPVNPIDG